MTHTASSRTLPYEPSELAAAKVIAGHFGIEGRSGGWLYDSQDRPVCHGWESYRRLVRWAIGSKEVGGQVRWFPDWRKLRRVGDRNGLYDPLKSKETA